MRKYGNRFVEMNIEKAVTENFIEIIYPNVRTSKLLQFDFKSVTTKIHGEGPLGFCQLMVGKVGL
jgi:hypothetical protein